MTVILRDEIGHVAVGNRGTTGVVSASISTPSLFGQRMAAEHRAPPARPHRLNQAARMAAGFSPAELALLMKPTD